VKRRTRPVPPNRERLTEDDLLRRLLDLLFRYRGLVRITILKNIALLTHALLTLFQGARGGNGWLSQAAVARCLPLEIGPKGRQLRLFRFLKNRRLVAETLIPLHVALVCGLQSVSQRLPMILDQTTLRGIQTLLIGLVFEGRVLPVAFSCFTYRMIQKSQNILEHGLILAVMSCFPVESRPLLIMDRGYARAALLLKLLREGIPFLVRAKRNVLVYYQGKSRALGRLSVKTGKIQCYPVLYHSKQKIPLNLIIFRGKGYQETWYLLIPQDIPLSPKEVIDLYARRMSIEQGFRDWKTHLGVRGLVFYCDNPAPRLTRLLLAFSLSYLLCLALGASGDSQAVRAFVEIPRRKSRHGTRRTLSSLSIGILRLSLPRFANLAHKDLFALLRLLSRGQGLISLSPPLPP
jgi:Transposase DDE domain